MIFFFKFPKIQKDCCNLKHIERHAKNPPKPKICFKPKASETDYKHLIVIYLFCYHVTHSFLFLKSVCNCQIKTECGFSEMSTCILIMFQCYKVLFSHFFENRQMDGKLVVILHQNRSLKHLTRSKMRNVIPVAEKNRIYKSNEKSLRILF